MKLICAADLHIGRCSSVLDRETHSNANAFYRLITFCNEEVPDVLIMAGDILDNSQTFYGIFPVLREGLKRLNSDISVVLVAGNHDEKNLEKMVNILNDSRVHLLGVNQKWERLDILEVPIYGWSLDKKSYPHSMFINEQDFSDGIVVCHGDYMSSTGKYAPFAGDINKISSLLTVVGHTHRSEVLKNENTTIISPGSLQAMDFGETGEHGAYIVEINNRQIESIELCAISSVKFIGGLEIDISDYNPNDNNLQSIFESELDFNCVCSYKIILVGTTDYYNELAAEALELMRSEDFKTETTYIYDITLSITPNYDIEQLSENDDAYGVIAKMILSIESGNFQDEYPHLYHRLLEEIANWRKKPAFKGKIYDDRESDAIDIFKNRLYDILNSQKEITK